MGDILWAAEDGYESVMDQLLKQYQVKEIHDGKFKFCDRNYEQHEGFSVSISCRESTENILAINFNRTGREPDSKATEGEISHLRSVNGSLSWIARQCRIDLGYQTSKLKSVEAVAQVKHFDACNAFMKEAKQTASRGSFYNYGAFNLDKALMLTISDASWANDDKITGDQVVPKRWQYGRICAPASPNLWDADEGVIHLISSKSGLLKRVCRSAFLAETHAMIYGTESSDMIRANITDLRGKCEKQNWEAVCAKEVRVCG